MTTTGAWRVRDRRSVNGLMNTLAGITVVKVKYRDFIEGVDENFKLKTNVAQYMTLLEEVKV